MPTNMSPPDKVAPTARACGSGAPSGPSDCPGSRTPWRTGAALSHGLARPSAAGLPFAANLAPRGEVGN